MHLGTLLVLVALAAAVVLLVKSTSRGLPIAALVIAGLQALLRFGVVSLGVRGMQVSLVLGIALAVVGVFLWTQAGQKTSISAATAVALVGVLQTVAALA